MRNRYIITVGKIMKLSLNSSPRIQPALSQTIRSKSSAATTYDTSTISTNIPKKTKDKKYEAQMFFSSNTAEDYANKGLYHFKSFDTHNALIYLDKAIYSFDQIPSATLTLYKKKLYAQVLTCKATIIRPRTYDGKTIAFNLVEKALELSPNLKEVLDLKNSLSTEYGVKNLRVYRAG